jgi:hypothetical protein
LEKTKAGALAQTYAQSVENSLKLLNGSITSLMEMDFAVYVNHVGKSIKDW